MEQGLVRIGLPAELARTAEQAQEYASQAKAEATRRAYAADWADFGAWCDAAGLEPLPAEPGTVILYLTARAETHRYATLQRRISSISQMHQARGLASPTKDYRVRAVWAGIRRTLGTAQEAKTALTTDDLREVCRRLPKTLTGTRDAALLLLGFASSCRRSELVAFNVEDLEFARAGLKLLLRRSKTDQEGQGRKIGIPPGGHKATCPVRAVQSWLSAAGIDSGPLFRPINRHGTVVPARLSAQAVALIVKRAVAPLGLDPELFAGHSLRSGHCTAAAEGGAPTTAIRRQTGHKSEAMLSRYIQDGTLFRDNSATYLGL